jgi:hypothetical protein
MSADFDTPPIYDPVTRESKDYLSDIWLNWISVLVETLTSYLTQGGIILPSLTTIQRNTLKQVQNGQMIYNTTTDRAEYYQISSGTWLPF